MLKTASCKRPALRHGGKMLRRRVDSLVIAVDIRTYCLRSLALNTALENTCFAHVRRTLNGEARGDCPCLSLQKRPEKGPNNRYLPPLLRDFHVDAPLLSPLSDGSSRRHRSARPSVSRTSSPF